MSLTSRVSSLSGVTCQCGEEQQGLQSPARQAAISARQLPYAPQCRLGRQACQEAVLARMEPWRMRGVPAWLHLPPLAPITELLPRRQAALAVGCGQYLATGAGKRGQEVPCWMDVGQMCMTGSLLASISVCQGLANPGYHYAPCSSFAGDLRETVRGVEMETHPDAVFMAAIKHN